MIMMIIMTMMIMMIMIIIIIIIIIIMIMIIMIKIIVMMINDQKNIIVQACGKQLNNREKKRTFGKKRQISGFSRPTCMVI